MLIFAFTVVLTLANTVLADSEEEEGSGYDVTYFPKEVTVDAAFRYDRDVILISGDEYLAMSPDGFERYVLKREGDTGVPASLPLKAAVRWPRKDIVYLYGTNSSYRANQTSKTSRVTDYGAYREFLRDGGPDAAAFRRNVFYIFRGCQYAAQKASLWKLGEPQNVADLNLPCDIDAAWTDENLLGMTLLKGDQIWTWRDKVEGPERFDSRYRIWSWQLKPRPENRIML